MIGGLVVGAGVGTGCFFWTTAEFVFDLTASAFFGTGCRFLPFWLPPSDWAGIPEGDFSTVVEKCQVHKGGTTKQHLLSTEH